MAINLSEIKEAINQNRFAPKKWEFEKIEHVDTLKYSCYGEIKKYEVTVKIKAPKYQDNAIRFLVNHYVDEKTYQTYYDGSFYI